MTDDGPDFLAGHDNGRSAHAASRGGQIQFEFSHFEDFPGEEDNRLERLPLGGGGNPAFEGEEVEAGGDGGKARVGGRLTQSGAAKAGEADAPGAVGLPGGDGEAGQPDGPAQGFVRGPRR
jgi:hypothetical protein